MERQTLIIDADDTLWENNIYFERAIEAFMDFLAHSTMSRADVRAVLDEIERANLAVHGYGARGFARNLRQTYEHLAERNLTDEDLATVMAFGEAILSQPFDIIPGVPETLDYLAGRHHLIMMTKGHPEEQQLKIDRSGLVHYFQHVAIVAEKDPPTYHALATGQGLAPETTWMIGNSPRSDINAPLAAGLNAVFVPHASTWSLELQELATGPGQMLIVERFTDLRAHF